MSSNQKICGLSYKISSLVGASENDKYAYVNNVTNNEFNDNDDLFGFLYDNKNIKDKWVLTSDYDNNIGWFILQILENHMEI